MVFKSGKVNLSDFCTTAYFPIFNTLNQIIETSELFYCKAFSSEIKIDVCLLLLEIEEF